MPADEVVTRRYSYLALLSGGGLGLITGALFFASLVTDWPEVLVVASRYSLIGIGPLLVGSLVVGIPALKSLNKRQADSRTAALFAAGLSFGLALLVSIIATVVGLPFGAALFTLGVPIVWTMVASGIGLSILSDHRAASIVALCVVATVSVVGAFNIF